MAAETLDVAFDRVGTLWAAVGHTSAVKDPTKDELDALGEALKKATAALADRRKAAPRPEKRTVRKPRKAKPKAKNPAATAASTGRAEPSQSRT